MFPRVYSKCAMHNRHRRTGGGAWGSYSPPTFFKVEKLFQRHEMSSSFVNLAKAPVARDNRHLSFGRFVIRTAINWKLVSFFNYSSNISYGLLRLNLYWEFLTSNIG